MRQKTIIVAAVLFLVGCRAATAPAPERVTWTGSIGPGAPTVLTIELHHRNSEISGSLALPEVGQAGVDLTHVQWTADTVHLEAPTPAATFVFDGRASGDSVSGTFSFGGMHGPFSLMRKASGKAFYREEQVTFRNGDVSLAGVILFPLNGGRHPGLVTLHGSGPETRSGGRFMAEHFVELGVAVLLYDKRGAGRSTGAARDATLNDYAGDAVAAFRFLQSRPEVDSSRTGIWGSSQASWVAAIAAERLGDVAFMLIKSGPLVSVAREAHYDTELLLRQKGFDSMAIRRAEHLLELDDEVTRDPSTWPRLVAAIDSVKSEKWYAAMHLEPLSASDSSRLRYRRNLDVDPVPHLRRVSAPVFWIYGDRDETVPAIRSAEIAERLRMEGKPYTVRILPGVSHAMMRAPREGEVWPRLSSEYVPAMTEWLARVLMI